MVHDVLELLGEQPDVERVQHRADAGHREVGLEVLLDVPRERADAVAGLDPEPLQRGRELLDAIAATSRNEARRLPSPSNVTTSLSPCTATPCRNSIPIVSG